MTEDKVVVIIGSSSDEEILKHVGKSLEEFNVKYDVRVASAHKTPKKLLKILEDYEASGDRIVYITVAGGSNTLSGFVDANTTHPVIACPPYSEKFGGADLYSSLRMPSGVCPLVILEPESAALAAIKILALGNPVLAEGVRQHQRRMRERVEDADERLRRTHGGE